MLILPRINEQEILPLDSSFKLRDIQVIMRNNLANEFRSGVRSAVLVAPTGSGKTIFAGYLFYNMLKKNPDQRLIFIVPRNTLIEQTHKVFTDIFKFSISVIQGIDERIDMSKQIHIATIQTIGRRIKKYKGFQDLHFGCCIVDECFTGDTKILTPLGTKLISNVSNGDIVYNATGAGIVEAISIKSANRIVIMGLSNGNTIKCTENHPLFTSTGWKNAGELGVGSWLFSQKNVSNLRQGNFTNTRLELLESKTMDSNRVGKKVEQKNDLLSILLEDIKESHARPVFKGKNVKNTKKNWAQASCSRGEWEGCDKSTSSGARNTRGGVGDGICCFHENKGVHGQENAMSLQNRHCKQTGENCDRSRRGLTLHYSEERAGQKEGRFSGSVRVESYQIKELESPELVYNLQVSGHPSYYADGVLVHNCHIMFKDVALLKWDMLIGLTATPYTKGLGLVYDKLIKSVPAKKLAEQGVITPIKVYCAKKQIDTSHLAVASTGEYDSTEEDEELISIVGDVLKEYKDNPEMKGRPFLGFAKSIKSCIALAKQFNDDGIRASFIHSKMSDEDCRSVLNTFEAGGYDGVFSVVKLIEGYDFPEASALLLCTSFAPSKDCDSTPNAVGRYIQMIGRVRRSYEGKTEAIIHDHGQNYGKYGHPDNFEHGFDSLDMGKRPTNEELDAQPKKASPKECPSCGYFIDVGNTCQQCGHKLKKYTEIIDGEPVEFIDGKMVLYEDIAVDPVKRNRNFTNEEKAAFYGGLKYYGRMNGYKPGWASHSYKLFFSVWPNKYKDAVQVEPNSQVLDFITAKKIDDRHSFLAEGFKN